MNFRHFFGHFPLFYFYYYTNDVKLSNNILGFNYLLPIRPPRAPWEPLDSGMMRTADGLRTEPFSPFFLKGHLVLQVAPRCSKVLHPGFDPGA